jgi:hypothetical protein
MVRDRRATAPTDTTQAEASLMKHRIGRLILVSGFAAVVHVVPAHGAPAEARRATLRTFAGTWIGHTRQLRITRTGRATESVDDGCCDHVVTFRYRLSRVRGVPGNAKATATVTSVAIGDPSAFGPSFPAPRVGEKGTVRLRRGVITEPFIKTNFCDDRFTTSSPCGA